MEGNVGLEELLYKLNGNGGGRRRKGERQINGGNNFGWAKGRKDIGQGHHRLWGTLLPFPLKSVPENINLGQQRRPKKMANV
jgi:hypothetical protein